MDSWTILLHIHIAQGRYIAKREATRHEWLALWAMAYEAYPGVTYVV